jgi:hypothetical protein
MGQAAHMSSGYLCGLDWNNGRVEQRNNWKAQASSFGPLAPVLLVLTELRGVAVG